MKKYFLILITAVVLALPAIVNAAQVCTVSSENLARYNECQNTPGMTAGDCDKLYRTNCNSTSSIEGVFGVIKLPSPISNIPRGTAGINQLIRVGIDLLFVFGAVSTLIFVVWGAIDYISSGDKKDGAAEARKKITYALIGLMLLGTSFFIVRFVGMIVGLGDLFQF